MTMLPVWAVTETLKVVVRGPDSLGPGVAVYIDTTQDSLSNVLDYWWGHE